MEPYNWSTEFMSEKVIVYDNAPIEQVILMVRGQKVILDRDLASLYGVPTKSLNRAVKRNLDRFPSDFMIQLTAEEAASLRCQSGTLKRGQHFRNLFDAIRQLMAPPASPKRQIGFQVRERRSTYRAQTKRSNILN
jgi:hypothetical protein